MTKTLYQQPVTEIIEQYSSEVICSSGGIDPIGSGNDFQWGNGSGDPNGSGDDFDWGN